MSITLFEKLDSTTTASVCRGTLAGIREDGTLMVRPETTADDPVPCDLLQTGATVALDLKVGAQVLYVPASDNCERGCVLGIIGLHQPPPQAQTEDGEASTLTIRRKEIEIVADSKLVLRCGEGALTITEDGTVIIKGSRMLSRAKGTNKIKGAAVQIN